MKKKQSNQTKAMEIYRPNNQIQTGRSNYPITRSSYQDDEVIDGQIELYRPEPQQVVYKEPRKPVTFNSLIHSVWNWLRILEGISVIALFWSFSNENPVMLWIRKATGLSSLSLFLALSIWGMLFQKELGLDRE